MSAEELKAQVAAVIDGLRPYLQAHGGDVELVDVSEDGVVKVKLTGACGGCPMAEMTLKRGIEARLKEQVPGVTAVVPVEPAPPRADSPPEPGPSGTSV